MTRALKGCATKALVLARGLGKRMRAPGSAALEPAQQQAADAGLKAMIPFGRPFLDHVLHSLAEAGFTDIALVIGPEHDRVREYYRGVPTSRITISFVTQREPLGTADAVVAGEAWSEKQPFVTLNSDNLYPMDVLARLRDAAGPAVPGFARDSLGLPLERIGAFALIERDSRGCLSRIVEKPGVAAVDATGPDALVSMNVWRFDSRIFDACRDVPVSERGEQELPQAVGLAADRGVCFEVMPVSGRVLDLSRREDIPNVATLLENADVNL